MKEIDNLLRALGFILLTLGILGIILPILPGWIFIISAVWILGWETIKEKTISIKDKIEKNNLERKSSYLLKLYLIPLEWTLLLEQKKIKEKLGRENK